MDADSQPQEDNSKAKLIFQIIPLSVGLIASFPGSLMSWSWGAAPWWYSILCSYFTFSILAFLVVEVKDAYQDKPLFRFGHKSLKYMVVIIFASGFIQSLRDIDYSILNTLVALTIIVMNHKTQRVLRSFEDLDAVDI